MNPVLIRLLGAGAVAALGYGLSYASRTPCGCCGGRPKALFACLACDKQLCLDCAVAVPAMSHRGYTTVPSGHCCEQHMSWPRERHQALSKEIDAAEVNARERAQRQAAQAKEQAAAKKRAEDQRRQVEAKAAVVVLYSKRFRGKVESPRLNQRIQTGWCSSQEEADKQLRILAAIADCAHVQEVSYWPRAAADSRNPNYLRKVWRAEGLL